ncbi:hypothetical protein Dda_9095 [Drechslerella dactyloides]|uniref:Uncharacterized protein n=1 Tax=Drechslerella dactyloides TaxID=74499 RepID=A0AAD6IPZ2_DREDA|nr:hypothetical protein Dda_9095 [Drechslerella dactyloides]
MHPQCNHNRRRDFDDDDSSYHNKINNYQYSNDRANDQPAFDDHHWDKLRGIVHAMRRYWLDGDYLLFEGNL